MLSEYTTNPSILPYADFGQVSHWSYYAVPLWLAYTRFCWQILQVKKISSDVFGIIPKKPPKSVHAKTVFARCSVFIPEFTDGMSGHCLIMANRRNEELHSGKAAFEGLDNSGWLPATYEVMDVVLRSIGATFEGFLGSEHAPSAVAMLKDRRDMIKKEVQEKISRGKKALFHLDKGVAHPTGRTCSLDHRKLAEAK